MAETPEFVRWSLERRCPYREGEGWERPETAARQLDDLRTLRGATADGDVVEGICVTSWREVCPLKTPRGRPDHASCVQVPYLGFAVAERFAQYGGMEKVLETCANCEANVAAEGAFAVAGCHGRFWAPPQSAELNDRLKESLAELGLTADYEEHFPKTTPIWYGLWIPSPLGPEHARVLGPVLKRTFAEVDERYNSVGPFLKALALCERHGTPLHVCLTPCGQSDFGWRTVFAHCPRCKASAPGGWRPEGSPVRSLCHVCGGVFNPADTHSYEPVNWDLEREVLETNLGSEAYGQLVRSYVQSQGYTPEHAAVVWGEQQKQQEAFEKAAAALRERMNTRSRAEVSADPQTRASGLEVDDD